MAKTLGGTETPSAETGPLIRRLLGLGWRFRGRCATVVGLHSALIVSNLGLLAAAGAGIDVLRYAVDPSVGSPGLWHRMLGLEAWRPYPQIAAIALAVLCLAAINAVLKFGSAVATTQLAQDIIVRLRSDVYDKLQRLSFRFYDEHDSSSIINRVAGDVLAVRNFIEGVVIKVMTVGISLTVYAAYMSSLHLPLTIACLATSPLLWCGAVWFSRKTRPWYLRSSELGDTMILRLSENIQGQQVIKGFSRESDEIARFTTANQQIREQKFQIFWMLSVYQPIMGLMTQFNMLVLIGYGGWLVIQGQLPLGAGMFVFANLLHEFANQVGQITNIANSIQTSLAGAERVFEVLDAREEIAPVAVPQRLPRAKGRLRFENVSFGYRPDELILKDISLAIQPGECIGFVGETGSGKTTLLGLIPRFYDVLSGRVLLDGIDVRELDLEDLRRNLGLVFQESFLFSNTISANIAFGDPQADQSRIEKAARQAAAAEFIEELPTKYQSLVGEHGMNLSGGQRQRLAIARALLLDPPIVILDDATAAVDAHTEHEIRQAVMQAQAGRTTIFVSNRVSLLRQADRIYVLDQGRIIQQGTHRELLHTPGEYRKLAKLQMVDEFLEPVVDVA